MKKHLASASIASIVVVLGLFAVSGLSVNSVSAETVATERGKLTIIRVFRGRKGILVGHDSLQGRKLGMTSCPRGDLFILPLESKHFEQHYSLLLAARTHGMDVRMEANSDECFEGFPVILSTEF